MASLIDSALWMASSLKNPSSAMRVATSYRPLCQPVVDPCRKGYFVWAGSPSQVAPHSVEFGWVKGPVVEPDNDSFGTGLNFLQIMDSLKRENCPTGSAAAPGGVCVQRTWARKMSKFGNNLI
jgi:hypothetical protein